MVGGGGAAHCGHSCEVVADVFVVFHEVLEEVLLLTDERDHPRPQLRVVCPRPLPPWPPLLAPPLPPSVLMDAVATSPRRMRT